MSTFYTRIKTLEGKTKRLKQYISNIKLIQIIHNRKQQKIQLLLKKSNLYTLYKQLNNLYNHIRNNNSQYNFETHMKCHSCKSTNIVSAGYYRFQCLKCGKLTHFDSRDIAISIQNYINNITTQPPSQGKNSPKK
jgi:predicted RNA-binding Zn-ribbon protein involved in translation (DUF1610 family)